MKAKKKIYHSEEEINPQSHSIDRLKPTENSQQIVSETSQSRSISFLTGSLLNDSIQESKTIIMEADHINEKLKQAAYPSFVLILGPEHLVGRHWLINKPEMSIGRSRRNHICIQEPSISKIHLYVEMSDNEKINVVDKNSTNGVSINNQLLDKKKIFKLDDNDQIKIGNVILKFLDRGNLEIFSIAKNFTRSFQDQLTKSGNRTLLECRAPELFKISKQQKYPLSVIVFDVDKFKNINDTYGHTAGDFILKEVARLAKSCFRPKDLFTRSGGEEFCVVLNSSLKRAFDAAENVRKKIAEYEFQFESHKIKLSISGGLSSYEDTDEKWSDIYERADKGLYQSKSSGRNKISIFN